MNNKTLATLATIIGIIVGSSSTWFTLRDRIEKQIEERVTRDINVETRIARIEERLKSLHSEVWTQRTNAEK